MSQQQPQAFVLPPITEVGVNALYAALDIAVRQQGLQSAKVCNDVKEWLDMREPFVPPPEPEQAPQPAAEAAPKPQAKE